MQLNHLQYKCEVTKTVFYKGAAMASKQGKQGAYNQPTIITAKELKRFRRGWVASMHQELAYSAVDRRRWQRLLTDK
jgi:hypothetical protein